MERDNNKVYEATVEFGTEPENEGFARMIVEGFIARLNPTLEELSDIRTAVSEAVTNSIIHGYCMQEGKIRMDCKITGNEFEVTVEDGGVGIENIKKAMEPLYTTKPELERSGMGFAFMEAFMDKVSVESTPGEGTTVRMSKKIAKEAALPECMERAVGFD